MGAEKTDETPVLLQFCTIIVGVWAVDVCFRRNYNKVNGIIVAHLSMLLPLQEKGKVRFSHALEYVHTPTPAT